MNYALFGIWIQDGVEDAVAKFRVPRPVAERVMKYVEREFMAAELEARTDAQFLLDFKREGATCLAERYGKSPQAMWQKRRKLLAKANSPLSIATTVD